MTYFLVTFVFMLIVVVIMAIGVIFGRRAIKGSCGGAGNGECVCVEKCDKKKKRDAEAAATETQNIEFNPNILKNSVD